MLNLYFIFMFVQFFVNQQGLWSKIDAAQRRFESRRGYKDITRRANEGYHRFLKRSLDEAWKRLKRAAESVKREEALKVCKKIVPRAKAIIKKKGDALLRIDERAIRS